MSTPATSPDYFCRKCAHVVIKTVDKTPGAIRCLYTCACEGGKPYFPILPVSDRNREGLARLA